MKFYLYLFITLYNYIFLFCSTTKAQTASGTAPAINLKIGFEPAKPCTTPDVKSENCVFADLFLPLTLKCVHDGGFWNDSLTLAWYYSREGPKGKDSDYVLVKDKDENRVTVSDGRVHFKRLHGEEVAYYACRVTLKKLLSEQEQFVPIKQELVEVQAKPAVTTAVKDLTVVEGNTINVTCVVSGKASRVYWKFEQTPMLNGTDNRVTLVENIDKVPDATMLIQHANMTRDRGHYYCSAVSIYGNTTTDGITFVRIKSKYAALGPFLGICAEVIILCTIILIYEKKRDKTELEESDTDQGPETKSSPDHGQDSVRYRK